MPQHCSGGCGKAPPTDRCFSHTPTENCLGGPTDPVQDGTLGGWGSCARSLFCLSCVSHPCLGTVPRAGVQTSPSPVATPLPPLPGSPIHSWALPPQACITLSSGYYPYAPFSLPSRRNGSSERTSGSDLDLGWETPKHVPQTLLQMPRLGLELGGS